MPSLLATDAYSLLEVQELRARVSHESQAKEGQGKCFEFGPLLLRSLFKRQAQCFLSTLQEPLLRPSKPKALQKRADSLPRWLFHIVA